MPSERVKLTEIEIDSDYDPGLYDSDTGESLVAEKVVDATAACPSGERTILLYTRAKRGRIVQIVHPFTGEKYRGSHIHFFVDELRFDPVGLRRIARRAGLSAVKALRLIRDNAPALRAKLGEE